VNRLNVKHWAVAFAFFAVFVIGRNYFEQAGAVDQGPEVIARPVAVDVVKLQKSYKITRRFSGRLYPSNVSDLGFPVGGAIVSMNVSEGDRIRRGDVLARLDDRQIKKEKDVLVATRDEVLATIAEAESTYARLEPLVPRIATPQRLDELRRERDRARASLKRVDARLDGLGERQNDLVLTAAFDGQIVKQFIETGTVVTAGQPIVRLNGRAGMEARIGVPARLREKFRPGESFRLLSGGNVASGSVISIVDDVNPGTQTITVVLNLDDPNRFTPSALVELDIAIEHVGEGVWVDAGSLSESIKGLWSVYTVQTDGEFSSKIVRNDVEILHFESDKAYVSGTLADGALVVRASPFRFVPGQMVRVIGRES